MGTLPRFLLICLAGIAATPVYPGLFERDWQITGDAAITLDDATGLEWLDVTETAGLTYNSVLQQVGPGGSFEGFSVASRAQVSSLISSAGLGEIPLTKDPGLIGMVETLLGFWGVTWYIGTGERTEFFTSNTEGAPAGDIWTGRLIWLAEGDVGVTAQYRLLDGNYSLATIGTALVRNETGPVPEQGTWASTLLARDLDSAPETIEAWYDALLDITWLADADYARTSGYDSDGRMTWNESLAWIGTLNTAAFLGHTGWRLPTMGPINGVGVTYPTTYDGTTDRAYNISAPGTLHAGSTASEMAHLYYNTLGNLSFYDTAGNPDQPRYGITNTGPFSNIRPYKYWTDLVYALDPSGAWRFSFDHGFQDPDPNFVAYHAWPVHPGDIGEVPVLLPGDINLDGQINAADVLLAQRHVLGSSELTPDQITRGDLHPVPGDGLLTLPDIILIIQGGL